MRLLVALKVEILEAWSAEVHRATSQDSLKGTKLNTTALSKAKKIPNNSNNITMMMGSCEVLVSLKKFKSSITRLQCLGVLHLVVRRFSRCRQLGGPVELTYTAKVVREALRWC